MKTFLSIFTVLLGIVLTTVSCEYLLNRSDSTFLVLLFVLIQAGIFYFLFFKPIKTLIKW